MQTYEQDWLTKQYTELDITQSNFSLAADWLNAMGGAAHDLNLTIQLCMDLPIMVLHSTTMPAVTTVRATGDYQAGNTNWAIGLSSLFLWSLGVQPFKDDFWSLENQPGNRYNKSEPNTLLHTLVAQLSTGTIAVSDAVGMSNATLIAITCRPDGLVLKPDVPAVTIDQAIAQGSAAANGGSVPYVTRAHTELGPAGAAFRWFFVLVADLKAAFPVTPSSLGPPAPAVTSYAVYDWLNGGAPMVVRADAPFTLPSGQGWPAGGAKAVPFRYYVFVPVLPSGWALIGETGKGVPIASQRLSNFMTSASGFSVDVASAPGEAAVVLSALTPAGAVVSATCTGAGAQRTLVCGGTPAACACAA